MGDSGVPLWKISNVFRDCERLRNIYWLLCNQDTYYKRDPYDSSGDDRGARYDSLPGRGQHTAGGAPYQSDFYDGLDEEVNGGERTIFKLERQWSHPNLRPRPHTAGRRLPKTPKQPPGIMIPATSPSMTQEDHMLEWVENERMHGRTRTPILTNQCSYESDNYSPPPPLSRNCREHTAYSPPRTEAKQRRTPVSERRLGTGRMLPKPPPGGSHLVLNAAQATIRNNYSLFMREIR